VKRVHDAYYRAELSAGLSQATLRTFRLLLCRLVQVCIKHSHSSKRNCSRTARARALRCVVVCARASCCSRSIYDSVEHREGGGSVRRCQSRDQTTLPPSVSQSKGQQQRRYCTQNVASESTCSPGRSSGAPSTVIVPQPVCPFAPVTEKTTGPDPPCRTHLRSDGQTSTLRLLNCCRCVT
jgi:hypothetical protein